MMESAMYRDQEVETGDTNVTKNCGGMCHDCHAQQMDGWHGGTPQLTLLNPLVGLHIALAKWQSTSWKQPPSMWYWWYCVIDGCCFKLKMIYWQICVWCWFMEHPFVS